MILLKKSWFWCSLVSSPWYVGRSYVYNNRWNGISAMIFIKHAFCHFLWWKLTICTLGRQRYSSKTLVVMLTAHVTLKWGFVVVVRTRVFSFRKTNLKLVTRPSDPDSSQTHPNYSFITGLTHLFRVSNRPWQNGIITQDNQRIGQVFAEPSH
jgi:hypothetical protein